LTSVNRVTEILFRIAVSAFASQTSSPGEIAVMLALFGTPVDFNVHRGVRDTYRQAMMQHTTQAEAFRRALELLVELEPHVEPKNLTQKPMPWPAA
jgi:hypothetical protein